MSVMMVEESIEKLCTAAAAHGSLCNLCALPTVIDTYWKNLQKAKKFMEDEGEDPLHIIGWGKLHKLLPHTHTTTSSQNLN